MELTKKQLEFIEKRRKYVKDLKEDIGVAPSVHLSMELHVYNALISLHKNRV